MNEQKKNRRRIRQLMIRQILLENENHISKGLAKNWAIYRLAHNK